MKNDWKNVSILFIIQIKKRFSNEKKMSRENWLMSLEKCWKMGQFFIHLFM